MTSLNIQTKANAESLKALSEFLFSIDPDAILSLDENSLSLEDAKKLKYIYAKKQNNELKFYSEKEFSDKLAQKGYDW